MDRQAISCFDQALTDVGFAESDPVREVLHDYFAWGHHNDYVPLSPLRERRPAGALDSPVVMGRPPRTSQDAGRLIATGATYSRRVRRALTP